MKESVTYQAIVEEGMLRARQEDLLQFGRQWFGRPSTEIQAAVYSITDLDRLARMIGAFRDVSTWEELLAIP